MYDVIIVGAGPGGAVAATQLARNGLRTLVLDRETFPRDKICGDAVSGKSVDVLKTLGVIDRFQHEACLGSWGVSFSSPAGDQASIPFTKALDRPIPPGFVCARKDFDAILVDIAREAGAQLREQTSVTGLVREAGSVAGVRAKDAAGQELEFLAPLVLGADGAYSVVVRELGLDQLNEDHYVAGLRAYYRGVTGFHERNHIELHFVEESIPGYFWIFPMPGGMANVGVGMLSSAIKKRDRKLKPMLESLVDHPRFKHRFTEAEKIGPTKGWGLPLGSRPRAMAGDGWMLIGDAASLIDPFTGEGIGNAMVSGMKAADWVMKSRAANRVDAAFLSGYGEEVLSVLRDELRLSHLMQKLGHRKWLLNIVIRKAARSEHVSDVISCMFDDLEEREKLISPMFYLKLLFA